MEARKTEYGNWLALHPDGSIMFYCDEKKANWYLSRNYAKVVKDKTIQLTFMPKGKGESEETRIKKPNICVGCGSTDCLTRHHIVPRVYRKHFPIELKEHNSYDVLLLCGDCHEKYERKADELKAELEKESGVPLFKQTYQKMQVAHRALQYYLSGTHHPKAEESLLGKIFLYDPDAKLTQEYVDKLEQLIEISKTEHGKMVVAKQQNIETFIIMWREHFLQNVRPKFLPEGWNPQTKYNK